MNVLLLSPYSSNLISAIDACGDHFKVEEGPVSREYCIEHKIDFLVSYGYRHLLKRDLLEILPLKAINLHISMLPYCRGAHPVFWSIVEGRPLGCTIHLLDEGLDTGNILFQRTVSIDLCVQTFASAYNILSSAIEQLFEENWKYLRTGESAGWRQQGEASLHKSNELQGWADFLPLLWDTPVTSFLDLAAVRLSGEFPKT
jgi:hypothetical protein